MNQAILYIHGRGGTAEEALHYQPLFPDSDVLGFDYQSETPWEAKREFPAYFASLRRQYSRISLIANSIGAFLAMSALEQETVKTAYFISPVVDMEQLILNRMAQARVTEDRLREEGEIRIDSGEALSWDYLCYVRAHPLRWKTPTHILCGECDPLTSVDTMSRFAGEIGATLEVMPNGPHWFHTAEQMAYLDQWIRKF